MRLSNNHTSQVGRPHFQRVMKIAQDHIWFSRSRPEQLEDIAKRLHVSPEAALAFAIADQITEEFTLATTVD